MYLHVNNHFIIINGYFEPWFLGRSNLGKESYLDTITCPEENCPKRIWT